MVAVNDADKGAMLRNSARQQAKRDAAQARETGQPERRRDRAQRVTSAGLAAKIGNWPRRPGKAASTVGSSAPAVLAAAPGFRPRRPAVRHFTRRQDETDQRQHQSAYAAPAPKRRATGLRRTRTSTIRRLNPISVCSIQPVGRASMKRLIFSNPRSVFQVRQDLLRTGRVCRRDVRPAQRPALQTGDRQIVRRHRP